VNETSSPDTDHYLDISDEICPMTFVKAKLLIERMAFGETARIRLQGAEPLDNVPRSITDYGHRILSLEGEVPDTPADGMHLLVFRKDP
jgi:TusA-related sulfurtransferase